MTQAPSETGGDPDGPQIRCGCPDQFEADVVASGVPCGRSQSEALEFLHHAGARVSLQPDEAFGHSEEAGDRILRLVRGLVRTVILLPDGRRQVLGFLFPGDMLCVDGGVDPSIVEAVTASVLLEYPADTLLRAAVCNRFLAADLTSALRASFAVVREHSVILGRCTALERVAWFASLMRDRLGGEDRFVLPMPRPDIADYLGLTVETLSRCLSRLRKMGLIDCNRQTIQILDSARLRSIAQSGPGAFGGPE